VQEIPGTRSAFADRSTGGFYLDVAVDRRRPPATACGSADVNVRRHRDRRHGRDDETVEGRERYPVTVSLRPRPPRRPEALRQVLVPTPAGAQVPLGQDVGSYVQRAREVVAERVALPPGYSIKWSGQFEYMERANQRLAVLIPITLAIIFLLLFLHFRSATEALLLMIPLPFAVVGAVWLMLALGYNFSIAVGVGLIAVAGLAAETGVVMHVYLDEAVKRYRRTGRLVSVDRLHDALEEGAVDRVRPKLMTVFTTIIGLVPIMIGTGTGSEVMQRIATPMVGGLVTSTVHTLIMIPALYAVVQGRRLRKGLRHRPYETDGPPLAFEPLAPAAAANDSHS
jgi:copper/silver efflux system protein